MSIDPDKLNLISAALARHGFYSSGQTSGELAGDESSGQEASWKNQRHGNGKANGATVPGQFAKPQRAKPRLAAISIQQRKDLNQ